MEIFDFWFIVNTAIGTAIGGIFVGLITSPIVISWLKKWKGWKMMVAVIVSIGMAILLITLLILFVPRMEDWVSNTAIERQVRQLDHWRDLPEAFALSCREECTQNETMAVENCSHVGNLYANPESRTDLLLDKTLHSMLPENLPEPRDVFRTVRKESPYGVAALARRTFDGCINKMGYTFEPCTADKQCYKIRQSILRMNPHKRGIHVVILEPKKETTQAK